MKKPTASILLLAVCLLVPGASAAPAPPGAAPAPVELSVCTDACHADYLDCRESCRYLPADERFYCLDACEVEQFDCLASCG